MTHVFTSPPQDPDTPVAEWSLVHNILSSGKTSVMAFAVHKLPASMVASLDAAVLLVSAWDVLGRWRDAEMAVGCYSRAKMKAMLVAAGNAGGGVPVPRSSNKMWAMMSAALWRGPAQSTRMQPSPCH
jgi:hypothetical protein